MGCQRNIAQQVVQGGADHLLAVKANQGELHENIKDLFACCERVGWDGMMWLTAITNRWAKTTAGWNDGSAGRSLTQRNWPTWTPNANGPAWARWPGSATGGTLPPMPKQIPVTKSAAIRRTRTRCWRRPEATGASRTACTGCWTWAFDEDDSRVRAGHADQNLAVIRHLALNLLKLDAAPKSASKPNAKSRMGLRLPAQSTITMKCDCPALPTLNIDTQPPLCYN